MLVKRFQVLQMYLRYYIKVEQNPVIPNINSSATHYSIYITSANYIYYIIYCIQI